jgi:hypothetical protein
LWGIFIFNGQAQFQDAKCAASFLQLASAGKVREAYGKYVHPDFQWKKLSPNHSSDPGFYYLFLAAAS